MIPALGGFFPHYFLTKPSYVSILDTDSLLTFLHFTNEIQFNLCWLDSLEYPQIERCLNLQLKMELVKNRGRFGTHDFRAGCLSFRC